MGWEIKFWSWGTKISKKLILNLRPILATSLFSKSNQISRKTHMKAKEKPLNPLEILKIRYVDDFFRAYLNIECLLFRTAHTSILAKFGFIIFSLQFVLLTISLLLEKKTFFIWIGNSFVAFFWLDEIELNGRFSLRISMGPGFEGNQ